MADNKTPDIVYTKVDEAPELASASLLPIIQKFAGAAGVTVDSRDISLAGRIISSFPEYLNEDQRQADHLAELGELVKTPEANVIIGAGAVVLANTIIPEGSVYAGVPAKKVKDISAEQVAGEVNRIADAYLLYASWYGEDFYRP